MRIYTYQPQSLVDLINKYGHIFVDLEETNMYKQTKESGSSVMYEAYFWMARKLAEKTGMWMRTAYGDDLDIPKDAAGDYIDENGKKFPLFPFWGWYLTDGKNQKPDPDFYCFDSRVSASPGMWSLNEDKTVLLTLDIPDNAVLLSDANAWYCALEGRPCYEYEKEEVEYQKLARFQQRNRAFTAMPERTPAQLEAKRKEADAIWEECVATWDNILRTEGRRLRNFMWMKERYDVQAVFPVIMKDWIVAVEEV